MVKWCERLYQQPEDQVGSLSPCFADLLMALCCNLLRNHLPLSYWGPISRRETHARILFSRYLSSALQTLDAGAQEKGNHLRPSSPGGPGAKESQPPEEGMPRFQGSIMGVGVVITCCSVPFCLTEPGSQSFQRMGFCHLEEVAE